MRRLLLLLSGFCPYLFFTCCCEADHSSEEVSSVGIRIVDSIVFETENDFVNIVYYNGHSFAGVNSALDKAYVFDQSGKAEIVIDQAGQGPEEYREIVKFGLSESNEIAIVDGTKFLIFSNDSKNILSCPLDRQEILPLPSTLELFEGEEGNFFFTSSSMNHSPSNEVYFESAHTITSFSKDCGYTNLGGYPETSLYRQKKFITAFEPQIFFSSTENRIYQIFPHGQNIFVLNTTGDLIQTIPITPDKFGSVVHRKENTLENMIYLVQKNSRFRNIVVGEELILLHYIQGLADKDISNSLAGYNKIGRYKRKQMLSIYDKNGVKRGKDFDSEDISFLIGFDKDDYLLFQKINDDDTVVVCKAEITI